MKVGDRVIWEEADPRGACWPLVLREGKVHEIQGALALVNVGIYAIPCKGDLVKIALRALVN